MTTLKDIATFVGVSISTVSRVINNDTSRHINPDTAAKVWHAVRELGYEPNESARTLVKNGREKSRPSKQIGCLVSGPHIRDGHPYFSPIISGMMNRLNETEYSLAFVHTPEEATAETALTRMILEHRIDGLIVIGWINNTLIEYIKSTTLPVVGISASGLDIPLVDYDRTAAAKSAVEHLLHAGHRSIAFVGGGGHNGALDTEERYQGYKYALFEAGIPLNTSWIINTHWNIDNSFKFVSELINRERGSLPTALFAASDQLAIPAMRAVIEAGLRIPADMAVMSMDNIDIAKYTTPPLSSVHVPKAEIGMTAVKTLLDQIQADSPQASKVLLPYRLIIRESSSPVSLTPT
ncbi:LacI family DNA-binding transcriptional regulator [Paenibacillus sp. GD4]|uniref:LacI family DNA-binding transcriptional regulator n=1 Tax=Paenibacillus sp. GD4 TaxID=3068890 RepID=UPI0027969198|nr:LacI family DNA-binding transcriptional regulator [Paenibacillus sp. GD4]MDQ1914807.1 LacI family DNA-binding transcriptional regulator [Paenibacillus sp. GD4]